MKQDEEERIDIRKRVIVTQQRIEMLHQMILEMEDSIRLDLKRLKDK